MTFTIDDIDFIFNENEYDCNLLFTNMSDEYLKLKNHIKTDHSLNKNITIEIKKPLFGVSNCGMRKENKITLFGINPSYLIHELVHIYMPDKNILLHEGAADYIQYELNNDRNWDKHKYTDIPFVHYGNKHSIKFKNLSRFLTNEKNYNDCRLNKCFFTRASAAIIFSRYRNKNKTLIEIINEFEKELEINGIEDSGFNKYFKQKNKNFKEWAKLERYGISHEGHPLEDWDSIDLSVRKKAFNLFLEEIKLDDNPV